MRIPRHWSRASERGRTCLGWSDRSAGEAEQMARERLARLLALGDGPAGADWEYYPASPLKEEILEEPNLPGVNALVTRNRAGAQVLNTDQVAFVDVDLHERPVSLLGSLFGRRSRGPDAKAAEVLQRIRAWVERSRTRLRAYRTAGGLRLLRMDRALDPAGEECARMFEELGADPQYARLCRVQRSFRARLTPKPRRVGCSEAPGSHPRTDAAAKAAFARWLERYERACAGRPVCSFLAEIGSGAPLPAAQAVVALHDQRTLRPEGKLA